VAYFANHKRLHLMEDDDGLRVNIVRGHAKNVVSSIPIALIDSEWIDYFERCARDDNHPISLMAVHLDEAVSIAVEAKMSPAKIVLDGTFAPIPKG